MFVEVLLLVWFKRIEAPGLTCLPDVREEVDGINTAKLTVKTHVKRAWRKINELDKNKTLLCTF